MEKNSLKKLFCFSQKIPLIYWMIYIYNSRLFLSMLLSVFVHIFIFLSQCTDHYRFLQIWQRLRCFSHHLYWLLLLLLLIYYFPPYLSMNRQYIGIHFYTHTHTHKHTYIYIYIYIERERERERERDSVYI